LNTEIHGLEEIIRKLNALPDKLENKVVRAAIRQGANIIKEKAKSYVPIDTGDLKKSIKVTGTRYQKGKISFVIRPSGNKKKGVSVFYARFIENGTSKMHAQPFMRPAFDESGDEVLNKTIEVIKSKLLEATA
jgi:HK97 gp10 family phage protein